MLVYLFICRSTLVSISRDYSSKHYNKNPFQTFKKRHKTQTKLNSTFTSTASKPTQTVSTLLSETSWWFHMFQLHIISARSQHIYMIIPKSLALLMWHKQWEHTHTHTHTAEPWAKRTTGEQHETETGSDRKLKMERRMRFFHVKGLCKRSDGVHLQRPPQNLHLHTNTNYLDKGHTLKPASARSHRTNAQRRRMWRKVKRGVINPVGAGFHQTIHLN